jgi:hypothetical protein
MHQLAAGRLRPAQHLGNFLIVVVENVVQQECCPFFRAKTFEDGDEPD